MLATLQVSSSCTCPKLRYYVLTGLLLCSWIEASLPALEGEASDAHRSSEQDHPVNLTSAVQRPAAEAGRRGLWDYR